MNFSIITLKLENINDFAKERNNLLKIAKTDWVFFLDSDEEMPQSLEEEIKKLDSTGKNGYFVQRKNYFCGVYSGSDRILRLAKKDAGVWERAVHEVWRVKGPLGVLKNPIIHNTAESVSKMIDKMNKYSVLHAQENKKEGKRSNIFKIVFYPKFMFLKSLFMGRGLVFGILQSFHSFLAWSNLWLIQRS